MGATKKQHKNLSLRELKSQQDPTDLKFSKLFSHRPCTSSNSQNPKLTFVINLREPSFRDLNLRYPRKSNKSRVLVLLLV